jgi:hypothetical protein
MINQDVGPNPEDFGVGQLTLKRLVEMMLEHDEGHVEDLRALHQKLKRKAT